MTPKQKHALESAERFSANASGEKWKDGGWPNEVTPQVLGALVRRGWLRSTEQSGGDRHSGIRRWSMYQITPAGLQALAAKRQPTDLTP